MMSGDQENKMGGKVGFDSTDTTEMVKSIY